ncbi:MAG: GTP cyclohydrolase MptA [Anaerolineales bacterium]
MNGLHTVYLGLGSNLGDRARNLAEALEQLQQQVTLLRVSPCYETEPWGITDQPRFYNLVCSGETHLAPAQLLPFLKEVETRLGRQDGVRYGPRLIDLDILFYDDLILDAPGLVIPHPRLHERAFVLAPLADIAPGLVHPARGETVTQMLAAVGTAGVERLERTLLNGLRRDMQNEAPQVALDLDRVGVTGLRRTIRLVRHNRPLSFYAEMDLFVDLPAQQKGAHMSRFSSVVEDLLEDWAGEVSPDVETLSEHIALQIVARQSAVRAEVRLRAEFPIMRHAPVSGQRTQEIYTLIGIAMATASRSVRLVGVEAEGMVACPCAQDMVRNLARERLLRSGFDADQAERALQAIPIATHNQRGRGTLLVSAHSSVRAEDLVGMVEAAMSSETYDLLKRADELAVVERAHRHPKFAEDVVRDMLAGAVNQYVDLPDEAFISARQVNLETIHKHGVFAERAATLGDLRRELAGDGKPSQPISLESWLESRMAA